MSVGENVSASWRTCPGCHPAFHLWEAGLKNKWKSEREKEYKTPDNPVCPYWLIFDSLVLCMLSFHHGPPTSSNAPVLCVQYVTFPVGLTVELGWTLNLQYVNRQHAARRLSHLKRSIRWAAPDILTQRRDYSGERQMGGERKDHWLNNGGKMVPMSHEMAIIRTVAKMLDLQKVIKKWQRGDINDESDKILRRNYSSVGGWGGV